MSHEVATGPCPQGWFGGNRGSQGRSGALTERGVVTSAPLAQDSGALLGPPDGRGSKDRSPDLVQCARTTLDSRKFEACAAAGWAPSAVKYPRLVNPLEGAEIPSAT